MKELGIELFIHSRKIFVPLVFGYQQAIPKYLNTKNFQIYGIIAFSSIVIFIDKQHLNNMWCIYM